MKLAEALLLRSDQQKKLASLKQRINANVLVQDGDEPSEEPNELIKQVFALTQESNQLIYRIHLTNAQAKLEDGKVLLSLLSLRDSYAEQHKILIDAMLIHIENLIVIAHVKLSGRKSFLFLTYKSRRMISVRNYET